MSVETPTVGRKLENLDLDDMDSLEDFNPRAEDNNYDNSNGMNLTHGSSMNNNHVKTPNGSESDDSGQVSNGDGGFSEKDVFGSEPFNPDTLNKHLDIPETNGYVQMNDHETSENVEDAKEDPFGMGSFQAMTI